MIENLASLTPNTFDTVTDSTTDNEIIDLALSFMKEGNSLCFFDFRNNPFTNDKIKDLQDLMEGSGLADNKGKYSDSITFNISLFGKEILRNGGWAEYKKEQKRKDSELPAISNTIIGDVSNSQIGNHDSSLDIRSPIIKPKSINNKWTRMCIVIWQKLKWLILVILTVLIGLFIEYKTGFFIPK